MNKLFLTLVVLMLRVNVSFAQEKDASEKMNMGWD